MTSGSLRLRLAAGGAITIALALLIAGLGLTYLFERHALRSLGSDLEVDLRQVLASLEVDPNGVAAPARVPADARFSEPLSGFYWQVGTADGTVTRSRSLWDYTLPLPADAIMIGEFHHHRVPGPGGTELFAVERTVLLKIKDKGTPVRVVVAGDIARVAEARRSFVSDLIPSLLLLGGVLATATWVQVGLGLKPLAGLREAVASIRQGKAETLDGEAPSEVSPLVEEINALLAAQENQIARSRGRAADLAHGLKTPLAALAADVSELEGKGEHEIAARIAEVGETMRRHVDRELVRARIHGARRLGSQDVTRLLPLLETLIKTQKRTAEGARLQFDLACSPTDAVEMEKADAAEVLGSLIENAARHARSRVRIAVTDEGKITVDDDGPGIPAGERDVAVARGERLDRRGGSAGLGLSIVTEVLDANGRKLELRTSPLGGLRAAFALTASA